MYLLEQESPESEFSGVDPGNATGSGTVCNLIHKLHMVATVGYMEKTPRLVNPFAESVGNSYLESVQFVSDCSLLSRCSL